VPKADRQKEGCDEHRNKLARFGLSYFIPARVNYFVELAGWNKHVLSSSESLLSIDLFVSACQLPERLQLPVAAVGW